MSPTGIYPRTEYHMEILSRNRPKDLSNDKNPAWKGENASYSAIHRWVSRKLGKPSKCSECGSQDKGRYEWANISGEYKREFSDWARLCVKCHRNNDDGNVSRAANKLIPSQVIKIREIYECGGISHRKLGKMFGVTHGTVFQIIKKQIWNKI